MTTKKLCINAMGIALFVVSTLCLQVPVFQNYYLCLGYIVMAFYTYHFGTLSGVITGSFGVLIYCLLTSGLRGMPGWILGNIVIGIICGIACTYSKKQKSIWLKQAIIVSAVVLSTAIGILGAKSLTETVLYSLPFAVRVATNFFAFVADIVVLIIGFELCLTHESLSKKITK
ncbi:MAG: ECF transporter S component [Oscillospiraceae bacterium]|nr:ECF transporter S component [Oscillospiraceae bacterium]